MAKQLTEERAALRKRFDDLDRELAGLPAPDLPPASVMAVVETFPNVAYGGSKRDMVVLDDGSGAKVYACVARGAFHEGELVVLITNGASAKASIGLEKWRGNSSRIVTRNLDGGLGSFKAVTFRADRRAYRHNPGIVIPIAEFPELDGCAAGDDVSVRIGVLSTNGIVQRELKAMQVRREEAVEKERADDLKGRYWKAREWRKHRKEETIGKAPSFVQCRKLEKLNGHPEYFTEYEDLLFDVTEKYNGYNLTVYYDADGDGKIHLYHDGMELKDDEKSFFWHVIRQQHVDRSLVTMGYSFALEGVVVGPSVRGGLFDGRMLDGFYVYDIYDNEDRRVLVPSERLSFCREAGIAHVKLVARQFPLFRRVRDLAPLLASARRPNEAGKVRFGLVFRSILNGSEIWFELANPDYRPNPNQLKVDARFDAMETRQGERP